MAWEWIKTESGTVALITALGTLAAALGVPKWNTFRAKQAAETGQAVGGMNWIQNVQTELANARITIDTLIKLREQDALERSALALQIALSGEKAEREKDRRRAADAKLLKAEFFLFQVRPELRAVLTDDFQKTRPPDLDPLL